jgi:hypothetical protein
MASPIRTRWTYRREVSATVSETVVRVFRRKGLPHAAESSIGRREEVIVVRLGVIPYCWDTSLSSWVSVAEAAVGAELADGLFAPDHIRVRDRFATDVTMPWQVVLGAASQVCGSVPMGPLVARCGSGNDEHVLNALDTLATSVEVVACLGVGDRIGRREAEAASLPWPSREERVLRMAETASRCLERGWETIVASDREGLHAAMPAGTGAHISSARSAADHGAGLGRAVSVSFWGEGETPEDLSYAREADYRWVCISQLPGEPVSALLSRLESARGQLRIG